MIRTILVLTSSGLVLFARDFGVHGGGGGDASSVGGIVGAFGSSSIGDQQGTGGDDGGSVGSGVGEGRGTATTPATGTTSSAHASPPAAATASSSATGGFGVSKQRMLGGLISAMLQFSVVTTGSRLCYMELSGLGVTVVARDGGKLLCAVFHCREDGADLHSLVAGEILDAFHNEYGGNLGADSGLKDFSGFHVRLADLVQGAVQPLIERLRGMRGVQCVFFVADRNNIYHTDPIDHLGVLANIQALLGHSTDIMTHCNDHARCIKLDGRGEEANACFTLIWRLHGGTLVVSVSKTSYSSRLMVNAEELIRLLNELCGIVEGLRGSVPSR